jgi:hypothetical protein
MGVFFGSGMVYNKAESVYKQVGTVSENFLSSPFDSILATLQTVGEEEQFSLDDPVEATKALLASMQGTPYTPPQRVLDPIYESHTSSEPPEDKTAPFGSPWKEQSTPFPSEFKADVNKRKGVIEAYLSVYDDPNTGHFV